MCRNAKCIYTYLLNKDLQALQLSVLITRTWIILLINSAFNLCIQGHFKAITFDKYHIKQTLVTELVQVVVEETTIKISESN